MLYSFLCVRVCSYLATRHYPVSNGQKRQPNGDPQHCPALHSDGLLPQTREVLVPDSEQLLLTIGMSNKLGEKNTGIRNSNHQRNMWKKQKAEDMKIGKIKDIKGSGMIMCHDCYLFLNIYEKLVFVHAEMLCWLDTS